MIWRTNDTRDLKNSYEKLLMENKALQADLESLDLELEKRELAVHESNSELVEI